MASKNSIEVYGALGKTNLLLFDPAKLLLVKDKNHPLFDPRVNRPIDRFLVDSIKLKGVVQPVCVWKDPETGETCVVDGRGRVACNVVANEELVKAGLPVRLTPAVVVKGDAKAAAGVMSVANEGRTDPTYSGRSARAVQLTEMGYSEQDVAVLLHCSVSTLHNYLRLAGACSAVRAAVDTGRISTTLAYDLSRKEPAEQKEALSKALESTTPTDSPRQRAKKQRVATETSKGKGKPKVVTSFVVTEEVYRLLVKLQKAAKAHARDPEKGHEQREHANALRDALVAAASLP